MIDYFMIVIKNVHLPLMIAIDFTDYEYSRLLKSYSNLSLIRLNKVLAFDSDSRPNPGPVIKNGRHAIEMSNR